MAFKNHYLGPNNTGNMAATDEHKLINATYRGEGRHLDLERYATLHKEQHAILEGLKEYGYAGMDEGSKTRHLLAGIKTTAFDSVKTQILCNAELRQDFANCVVLFKDYIMQVNKPQELNVSSTTTRTEIEQIKRKPQGRIEDRYYTNYIVNYGVDKSTCLTYQGQLGCHSNMNHKYNLSMLLTQVPFSFTYTFYPGSKPPPVLDHIFAGFLFLCLIAAIGKTTLLGFHQVPLDPGQIELLQSFFEDDYPMISDPPKQDQHVPSIDKFELHVLTGHKVPQYKDNNPPSHIFLAHPAVCWCNHNFNISLLHVPSFPLKLQLSDPHLHVYF